jgi:hypothetical protein
VASSTSKIPTETARRLIRRSSNTIDLLDFAIFFCPPYVVGSGGALATTKTITDPQQQLQQQKKIKDRPRQRRKNNTS